MKDLITSLFEERAAKSENDIAVICDANSITYGELNERANQLARYLQNLGVGPEKLVAICLNRSIDVIVGILAILKAGGAYVPMASNYPPDRLKYILNDCKPVAILTDRTIRSKLSYELNEKCYLLDELHEKLKGEKTVNVEIVKSPKNAAYVIYTSGSTGQPKGVVLQHESICNTIKWCQKNPPLTSYDRFLHQFSFGFDGSVLTSWWPLLQGMTLILPTMLTDIDYLTKLIVKERPSVLCCAPSILNYLLKHPLLIANPGIVKWAITGGEAMLPELLPLAKQLKIKLMNHFGPTECAVLTSDYVVKENKTYTSIPIGTAIGHMVQYILDENLEEVAPGESGELYISGIGVGRGYLNRPDLTAERFIANPFSHVKSERMYKTGDLCKRQPDGNILYVGRIDQQVNIRGFRIELGEIESILLTHPAISEVAVIVQDSKAGTQQINAFYTIKESAAEPTSEEFKQHLMQKLPDYMLPNVFFRLQTFPLTHHGKIDKKALAHHISLKKTPYRAPQTVIEKQLADIWEEVLRHTHIGTTDNFFELGGDSLLVTQVTSRIRHAFDKEFSQQKLFKHPTILGLADYIQNKAPDLVHEWIPKVDRMQQLPLSCAEDRLWFIHQLDPSNPQYNTPYALRIKGQLNENSLENAVNRMVSRHEILRTTFGTHRGIPYRQIMNHLFIPLKIVEIADEEEFGTRFHEECHAPFDLAKGPLIRSTLFKIKGDEFLFLLNMHHIVVDGWSVPIITNEIFTFYKAEITGSEVKLPDLTIQYADFAAWQHQWLNKENPEFKNQCKYWEERLANYTKLDFPTDKPRPAVLDYKGKNLFFEISEDLVQDIKQFSAQKGVTLYMTLLTAFYVLLYRYTNQEDIIIGSAIANRNKKSIENLIGFFVNMLVLRANINSNMTFNDLLQQVKTTTLEAYDHQDMPFDFLVNKLKVKRSASYSPLFQIMFIMDSNEIQLPEIDIKNITITEEPYYLDISLFDLHFHLNEIQNKLACRIEYSTSLFKEETIKTLKDHYEHILKNIVANQDDNVFKAPIMSGGEIESILNTAEPQLALTDKTLHELFILQAKKSPDHAAVTYGEKQITYKELDERSDQLAHGLIAQGIKAETRVAVYLDRSIELIICLLGILKAGGAYVLIDPNYPVERINYMINDSLVNHVIVNDSKNVEAIKKEVIVINVNDFCIDGKPGRINNVNTGNLAHVIYTSGARGNPLGVQMTHSNMVNHANWNCNYFKINDSDIAAQLHPPSFDGFDREIWPYLISGATVKIVPEEFSQSSSQGLLKWMINETITIADLPAAYAGELLSLDKVNFNNCALRILKIGGEKLPTSLVGPFTFDIYNVYGPTEATDEAFCMPLLPAGSSDKLTTSLSIGKPLSTIKAFILDSSLALTPVNALGELYLTGAGVARGYLNRPGLTAERFIPNPFITEYELMAGVNTRLYKTGELCRLMPAGHIEYIKRVDSQVTIDGYRVELLEVEALLMKHPAIKEAAALTKENKGGDKSLVVYYVPKKDDEKFDAKEWGNIHHAINVKAFENSASNFNITKWNSSYTKKPVPAQEMNEWVQTTVERIKALKPKRVLEIGCGTGQLLFQLAPLCEYYCGTDFCANSLDYVKENLKSLPNVKLVERSGEVFAIEDEMAYDVVIINSVVQYFPDQDYLEKVIAGAIQCIKPGGSLFIGDVRCLDYLSHFHALVELQENLEGMTVADFIFNVQNRASIDNELAISPRYFYDLPGRHPRISHVQIDIKRGHSLNEATQFRYDVVLGIEKQALRLAQPHWLSWKEDDLTLEGIQEYLSEYSPEVMGIRAIPNARIQEICEFLNYLTKVDRDNSFIRVHEKFKIPAVPIHPEDLWKLADQLHYFASICWSQEEGCFDVLFISPKISNTLIDYFDIDLELIGNYKSNYEKLANNPLKNAFPKKELPANLRNYLKKVLPAYMIPSSFIELPALPRTPQGKVDREALFAISSEETLDHFASPQTPAEKLSLAFWKRHLEGAPLLLELPADRARPSIQTLTGKQYPFVLPFALKQKLDQLCQHEEVTLFMLVLASLYILLSRYSNQKDMVIGTPFAVGSFMNNLPLRATIDDKMSFLDFLKQVKQDVLNASTHKEVPFEKLIDYLKVEHSLSYSPLFQVMFALKNADAPGLYESGNLDLTLMVTEAETHLDALFEYSTDLFDQSTIERMAQHWQILLDDIVADPSKEIAELTLLSSGERQMIIEEWNATGRTYPRDKTVHQLFEEQVEKTPNAIALCFEDNHLTYKELNEKANQLARYLQKQGVGPDKLVGICMERSLELIIGLIAILKAGGAYLPLSPDYPQERIEYILQDSGAATLLTEQKFIDNFTLIAGVNYMVLSQIQNLLSKEAKNNVENLASSRNLCYVIYTSGSTGKPKGVVLEHHTLTNLISWQPMMKNGQAKVLQFANMGFDVSLQEIFFNLLNGGTLYIVPREMKRIIKQVVGFISKNEITTAFLPTALLDVFVQECMANDAKFSALQEIIVAGEALRISNHIRKFFQMYSHIRLVNHYGPSEAHVVSFLDLIGNPDNWKLNAPIGKPISNVQLYILSDRLNPVAVGACGELFIGGDNLARGYLNRSDLTAEKFIPNPFSSKPGERLYKTGDLCRYLPDGNIEYIARSDHQVKIRGFRIELGEIEALLSQYPAVKECVILVREDPPGNKFLVAYIVPKANASLDVREIRNYLSTKLPDYMLPGAAVCLDSLPLTPNGKVDKKALLAIGQEEPSQHYAPPQTASEKLIVEIFQDLLKRKYIGIKDSFFDIGGHSLLATQVVSRINEKFHIELPLQKIFETPVVEELAKYLESVELAGQQKLISRANRSEPLHLSFAQQRLWFLEQLKPERAIYNMPYILKLKGKLNLDALQHTLQTLVDRHESLRTAFIQEGEEVIVKIADRLTVAIPLVQCNSYEAKEYIYEEIHQGFNLTELPLFRTKLLQTAPNEFIFILVFHHIISDGWSIDILNREWTEIYGAFTENRPQQLPPLQIQYADYACWQRSYLQGEWLEKSLSYWQSHLAGAPSLLELPTDRVRPSLESFKGSHYPFVLPLELKQKLNKICQQEQVTLFMLMLSSFYILLSRYSNQKDLVIGTPIANRNRQEIEGIIGFFVNTLALRATIPDKASFLEFLQQVKQHALKAYAHQEVPFEKLVDHLKVERSLSHSPLFQVMLALNTPYKGLELPQVTVHVEDYQYDIAKFELTLFLNETEEHIDAQIEYATDLFDRDTIERMAQHWQNLLEDIVQNPTKDIAELTILSPTEKQMIVEEWNATEREYPQEKTIHQLFEEQVEKTPNAVALVFEDKQLTYRELNAKANQLAHYLRAQGVKPETIVAICMERSQELIIGILGILKAGGAYLPIDPDYPQERIAYMLEDSAAKIIITQRDFLHSKITMLDLQHIILSDFEIQNKPVNNLSLKLNSSHLAYVIYTSGSTGRPKGVQIAHSGISDHLLWYKYFRKNISAATFLHQFSFSFDGAVVALFWPLSTGDTVIMPKSKGLADVNYLVDLIKRHKIEALLVIPGILEVLIEALDQDAGSSIKTIMFAGEALNASLINKTISKLSNPDLFLWNLYGPSEYSVECTSYELRGNETNIVPIGKAISNTQVYILNDTLHLCPVRVPGELHIGGVGLARGYLNRPDLTAEKFIPNPFIDKPGERLYKTGDLCRYLPDGNIEYIGRIDHQVKIRGFRIELGEIEALLAQHASVKQCVVLTYEDATGVKRLVAYIVPEANKTLNLREARDYLNQQLPDYMLPNALVSLKTFPLTPNGKLDHKSLPAPDVSGLMTAYVPPTNPLEEEIVAIWESLLHQSPIGISDSFFERGGHSLLATQVVSRIRKQCGVEVPLQTLFKTPTVQGLAKYIQAAEQVKELPLVPVSRHQSIPLSFAQQRLWFLDQFEPGSATYNIPLVLKLEGKLNKAALTHTFQALVDRHESLRTAFAGGEEARQIIVNSLRVEIPVILCKELEADEFIRHEVHRGFNLNQAPLFRVTLLELAPDRHILIFNMHHIISDGWSIDVLNREWMQYYHAYTEGEAITLPPLTIQYADFAAWQRTYLAGEHLEKSLAYWKNHLAGAPALLELPIDKPRPAVQSYKGSYYPFQLPSELTQQLKDLSQKEQATLFMTLLASFYILLSRYSSSQKDIVVGTTVAGRNRQEIEGLIGFFVNTLALRAEVNGRLSFSAFLQQVKRQTVDAYAHQDVPFEKLVDHLKVERSLSHSPLFQAMFILQNVAVSELNLPNLTITPRAFAYDIAKFDLTMSVGETKEGLNVWIEYATDLFEPATIERMAQHWEVLLEGIVQEPTQLIGELPILAQAEKQNIIYDWNATEQEFPQEKSIHQLFEEQVKKTPDAVAAVFEDKQLTYTELNAKANQLAHYLQAQGVKPETLVAIFMERSLELIIALLAVLKAGGAYLPLDPSLPNQRLAYMLENGAPSVLLTLESFKKEVELFKTTKIYVNNLPQLHQESKSNPMIPLNPQNASYVIYTSGSTGNPKGVLNFHAGTVNRLLWMQKYGEINQTDSILQKTPYTFDVSVWEFFLPLICGARLVFAKPEGHKDPAYLSALIESEQISIVHFVPSMLQAFLETLSIGKLESLKKVFTSGEALPLGVKKLFFEKIAGSELHNLYGPTEASVDVTYWDCGSKTYPEIVPIGKPIWNTKLFILDEMLNLVPVGAVGELYLGGVGLARGYVNRPDLTAEKFIPNPFSSKPGERLYKTGDLCRYLPDGNIEYMGRIDHQIKIRGFRIELGEIETVLATHPAVRECVVLAREDVPGEKRLVAYLVLVSDMTLNISEVRKYLKQYLPDYMLPSALVTLEAFPLTPNGKLDRKALPMPDMQRDQKMYVAPRNETERVIAEIWQKLLHVEKVGIHDNFFDLGGHSLRVTQLAFNLKEKLRYQFPLKYFFSHPTIASLTEQSSENPMAATIVKSYEKDIETARPLHPPEGVLLPADNPKAVLLTGSSGFFGAYLLSELLQKSSAAVYCLIRGKTIEDAQLHWRENLAHYGFEALIQDKRIQLLYGDLAQPNLGLTEHQLHALAQDVDAIYHNGAQVHHLYDYETLRAPNVLSTIELLKLASQDHPKRFYFVSTLSPILARDDTGRILEQFPNTTLNGDEIGYVSTKWVSEKILAEASQRGFAVTIYRPGQIMGDIDHRGPMPFDQFYFTLLLKGCIQMGAAPMNMGNISMLPVNALAEILVASSLKEASRDKVYNLSPPDCLSVQQIFIWLTEMGYSLKLLPFEEWRDRYLAHISSDNAFYGYQTIFLHINQEGISKEDLLIQCDNTQAFIKQQQLALTNIDGQRFKEYIATFDTWFKEGPQSLRAA